MGLPQVNGRAFPVAPDQGGMFGDMINDRRRGIKGFR